MNRSGESSAQEDNSEGNPGSSPSSIRLMGHQVPIGVSYLLKNSNANWSIFCGFLVNGLDEAGSWNLKENPDVSTDVNIVRTVRHRSRLLIAVLFLLAQLAMGRSVLICTLSQQQLAEGLCPMQSHSTSDCCHKHAKPKKDFSCYVSSRQQVATAQVVVPHFEVAAIVFEPISVEATLSKVPVSAPIHLILPRIRTPDIGANGLRAPPSR